ncbi:MAG TPA: sigma 54-interacting transcriptional regulator [Candidatus Nitrosotalea sp.]|nr:sigma 54-interacting transcriptional regulator [Candidatus Nitrosotalea sp.]
MDPSDELLGRSPAIEATRETLRRLLGRHQATRRLPAVLIQGETGTGKNLVARFLHRHGPRAQGPFVDVNCAAIPETLIEAELFGYERGAFTDARRAKAGLFQTANLGTIFLDEVGLLPDALQAKLLTVLEERTVRRLGGTHPEPADAWVISATNTDLQQAIRERRFREDLYHRLAVLTLRMPSLRERGSDVLLLADHFLARICADYSLGAKTLAPDARERLMAYRWPGNVRELSNVIERATLLAEGPTVTADDLALGSEPDGPGAASAAPGADRPGPPTGSAVSLDDAMREHLRAALHGTGWNISRTAAALGISRNTLRARIERLGLREGARPGPPARRGSGTPTRPAAPSAPVPESVPTSSPAAALGIVRWERRRVTMLRARLLVSPDADEELLDASRGLEMLVSKVHAFSGHVEALSQTGLDASFGVDAVEDAPRRAANAALAILKAAEHAREERPGLGSLKVALHTGSYMLGQISGAPHLDQAGQQAASAVLEALLAGSDPGTAVVSADTAPFLERRFALAATGSASRLTGQPYRLAGREGSGLGLWGHMTRFVGRGHELELLRARFGLAQRGQGQVVGLVGEPGVGKSRLLWEFTHSELGRPWLLLDTAAGAVGTPAPYLPIVELLRRYFQLEGGEPPAQVRERVADRVRELDENLLPSLPPLLTLLDVPVTDGQWLGLDPPQRRRRSIEAVKRLLLRESRRQPVLLVVEDTHWVDSETQAVLDALVDGLPTADVLLLMTYRPEYAHGWAAKTFFTQVRVDPLSAGDSEALLRALLGEHPSLGPLLPRLVEWTEGNPFFLEESVRALRETGVLAGDRGDYRLIKPVTGIQVPATVEEVLAARIARLTMEQRRLLQSAAVIGKDVPSPILAAIADLPEDTLAETLRSLQGAEFLYETQSMPDPGYTFKHALTHEVAYDSVARGQRALHARILTAMETLYPGRLAEHVDRLAQHAFRGHVWPKAVTYLRQAGARAFAHSANREAVGCYEQALLALREMEDSRENQELAIDLHFDLRNALTPLGEVETTLEHLRLAQAGAERVGDRARLGRAYSFAANALHLNGDQHGAIRWGTQAMAIGTELDDFALRTASAMYIGRAHHALGAYAEAIRVLTQVVESLQGDLGRQHLGLPVLPAVFARAHLVGCLAEVGRFPEAFAQAERAVELAGAVAHPDTLVWAYRGLGQAHLLSGDGAGAAPVLGKALALCRVNDLQAYLPPVAAAVGLAYTMIGRAAEGLPLLEQAVADALVRKQIVNRAPLVIQLADAYLLAGRLEEARQRAADGLELARRHGQRGSEAQALCLAAEASMEAPEGQLRAEAGFREAATLADALGMRPLRGRCELGMGRLATRRGLGAAARGPVEAAAAAFRELGMTVWLRRAEDARAALG